MLSIVYFVVVTPIGLVTRLVRDPLARRRNRRATTYWIPAADR
jgi:hypothetical protein